MNLLLVSLLLSADPAAEQAKAALAPFKAALKAELTAALEKGTPVTAIEVCAGRAPALAAAWSRDEVVVGRSALKRRSAANAPKGWLLPVMTELSSRPSGSEASALVDLPGGKKGYAEAIWVQQPCLTCHGEALAPEVDKALKARYPADAARGFKLGDFRGVFWAEVPASKPR